MVGGRDGLYAGFCAGSGYPAAGDDHPSRGIVADALERPTRLLGRTVLMTQPVWPCSGWGLPSHPRHRGCWWSLTPPFHPDPHEAGGLFSVALACGLPRVGVTHHPVLRSPDVPRAAYATRDRPAIPSAHYPTGAPS